MASYNRVILVGNVTRDPELRYIPSGSAVVELGLAVNDRRKNQQGEWIEETTFIDVTLWARQAEIASEYLTKGAPVLIEGRLKLDTWEQEGQKRSKLRVIGERMQMLGTRGGGSGGGGGGGGGGRPAQQRRDSYDSGGYDGGGYDGGGYDSGPSSGAPDNEIPF